MELIVVYVIAGMFLIGHTLMLWNQQAAKYVFICGMVVALLDAIYLTIT